MKKSTKHGIIKKISLAVACAFGAGIIACAVVGGVGFSYNDKAERLAIENGYDVANANYKTEMIATYTYLYNQKLISDKEYRSKVNNPENLDYDTFISESSLAEEVKTKYYDLREKENMSKALWGMLPETVLVGISAGIAANAYTNEKKFEMKEIVGIAK